MKFEELCDARYSLRKFDSRPVEAEKLQKVLEAGRKAPTAHNLQPQRFFVMQSEEALAKADACTACHFHSPVVIVAAYDPEISWKREEDGKNHGEIDVTLAVSQMMLQARLWLSFRYFGKTYANLQEALYFNGRWETFGGINWNVNKHLSLGATVINFLNQKGASGTINGSELITKEEAAQYAGNYMSGNYLRPFTVEFSASIKF